MNQIAPVQPRDYHDVIARVAAVKSMTSDDVEKLQRMMAMQEDLEKRQAVARYNENMSLAQGEMTQISKDSSNPQTRSRYASLEALDAAIRPIYTKYGFSVSFNDETPPDRVDWLCLVAYVSNGSAREKFTKWIPVSTSGIRGQAMMTATHASIASVTYGRRALLKMIFNLAEEDTDGNFAQGQRDEYTGKQQVRDITQDQFIEEMRACKDHTALYTWGQANRPTYLKFGPATRKLCDEIYKALMEEFSNKMDEGKPA